MIRLTCSCEAASGGMDGLNVINLWVGSGKTVSSSPKESDPTAVGRDADKVVVVKLGVSVV